MTAEIPVRSSGPAVIAGPCSALRSNAMEVAMAGLTAADPGEATRRTVSYDLETDTVWIGGRAYPLASTSSIWVVGAGKATYRVGEALESVLGDRLAGGVVAVRDPDLAPLDHIKVLRSDHPLPSERSGQAANDILSIARSATKGDLVLACFTGGSSALASLPPAGVSPTDKRALHEVLLSSGLAITDINVVRKAVSDVKGGRVALAAAPATLVNLTVSDVAGSPLDTVTDPTVQDTGTAAQARAVLSDAGLWEQIPASVYVYLEANHPTPRLGDEPQTVVLADGASTVAVMESAAHGLGYRTVVAQEVEGDADVVGPMLAGQLLAELDREPGNPVMLLGCGGEAVVRVSDPSSFSKGGPNQHAALRVATVIQGHCAAALMVDTDGSDGGTDLAGALVDGTTVAVAAERGVDLEGRLAECRSSETCLDLDAAVRTGHTGTNVNDLFVLVAEAGDLP